MRRPIRTFTIERKRPPRITILNDQPLFDLTPPPPPAPPAENRPSVPRWAAAEALFAPQPQASPSSSSKNGASAPITGRILQSLVEPPAPQVPDFAEDMPKRRGRKPGSRNKARIPLHPADAQDMDAQGPRTIEKVMRNLFEFWAAEDDAPATEAVAVAPSQTPVAVTPAPALQLRRRARIAREELPRGERWKARLPKFAR
ncbi:MAG: hypothetical protein K2Y29_14740 [Beijerinckiaceae bacterium]|nr:hypothetical protein [Beijerinckiaceae bacterium]